jgi:cytochrome c oxidase subunit IV
MASHVHTDHSHGHGNAARTYTLVLAALVVLTVVTVAASRIDFGTFNVIIALVIATVKGSLVALFFMHLRYDKPMNAIIFLISLAFLALFLISCLTDYETRWSVQPTNLRPPSGAPAGPLTQPAVPGSPAPVSPAVGSGQAPAPPAAQPSH